MEAGIATAGVTASYAGFWRRFAGAFIDGIVIAIVDTILRLVLDGVGTGLGFVASAAYFTYFHGKSGQTPGNAALSIRVVDKNGHEPIGYGRAFVRWIVSIVSGIVILVGYLWMLWDRDNQTWHDKAANSVVVHTGSGY